MYKEDLTLNNLPTLICHKTKPNQTSVIVLPASVEVSVEINRIHYFWIVSLRTVWPGIPHNSPVK